VDADEAYRVHRPHVIFENVDGELILVHLEHGCYFSVDPVGADIWDLIDSGHSVPHIVEALRFRYDAPADEIRRSVRAFVDRLLEERLIVAGDESGPRETPAADAAAARPAFRAPQLEKYTDMKDMLALDPVHDVEAAGWPVPKVEEESWPSPDDATGPS